MCCQKLEGITVLTKVNSEPPNAFHNVLKQIFPFFRYEGVSKTFQRTSMMLTFAVDHCYSLLFTCYDCSVSANAGNTAGTLESHVGWLLIVHEFQGHPGNDILVTVISFLKTRIKHREPDQASTEGGRPQPCFYWQRNAFAYAHLSAAVAHTSWRSTTSSSPSSKFTLQQA